MFPFMCIRWTFFAWFQIFFFFFFFSAYGDCFQCVLIETGDICIPSLGGDVTWQILIWVGLLFLVLAYSNHSAYCCICIDCRQTSWGITLSSLSFEKGKKKKACLQPCCLWRQTQICNADCLRLKVCHWALKSHHLFTLSFLSFSEVPLATHGTGAQSCDGKAVKNKCLPLLGLNWQETAEVK